MRKQAVMLLHGFASSGNSRKAGYLREKLAAYPEVDFHAFDFNPTPRDFEFMTITGLIDRVRQYVLDRGLEDLFVVGSSMGALVGLHYAHRFGGVGEMLLLAPALYFGHLGEPEPVQQVFHFAFQKEVPLRDDYFVDGARYAESVPPPAPITIIHGRHDDVIPVASSRAYAAAHTDRVRLMVVESDHRLSDQLDAMWEHLLASLLG